MCVLWARQPMSADVGLTGDKIYAVVANKYPDNKADNYVCIMEI